MQRKVFPGKRRNGGFFWSDIEMEDFFGLIFLSCIIAYLGLVRFARWRRDAYMEATASLALRKRRNKESEGIHNDSKGSTWRVHNVLTALELEFEAWLSMSSRGLFLTYAIPSISGVLFKTGGFEKETARRYADMEILIREFNENAVDGTEFINDSMVANFAGQPERAKTALFRINAIHQKYKSVIKYEDMIYVWSVFACTPARWMESRWSVRPLTADEKECIYHHWIDIGKLMNLQVDTQFNNWDEIMDYKKNFEKKHMRPTKSNFVVASSTIEYFLVGVLPSAWMRNLFRPIVLQLMSCLQDDPSHALALGLPKANPFLLFILDVLLTFRALAVRWLLPPTPAFMQDRLTGKSPTVFTMHTDNKSGSGCPMKSIFYPARTLDFNNTTYIPLKISPTGGTGVETVPEGGYSLEDMGPPSVKKGYLCEKPVYLGHPRL